MLLGFVEVHLQVGVGTGGDDIRYTQGGVEDVLASAILKGSEKFRELYGTEEDQTVESESQAESEPQVISSGDYDYLISDKTAAIVKYNGDADDVMIPSEINEYQVTRIGAEAFRYRKMKSVSILTEENTRM